MATSGSNRSAFSDRPRFFLSLQYSRIDWDPVANRTTWNYGVRIFNDDRTTQTWTNSRPNLRVVFTRAGNSVVLYDDPVPAGSLNFQDGAAYHDLLWRDTDPISGDSLGGVAFSLTATLTEGPYGTATTTVYVSNDQDMLPDAPPRPVVAAIQSQMARVTWGAADGNGSTILEYQAGIWRNYSNGVYSGEISVPKTGTTREYSFLGLDRDTTYYVRARARTGAGTGAWSPHVVVTTLDGIPSAPGTPSVSDLDTNSLTLSWGAATPSSGDPLTGGYEIQRSLSSNFSSPTTSTTSAGTRTLSVSNLARVETYYFRVRARSDAGAGPWSGTRTVTTPGGLPTAPNFSSLSVASATSVTLTFSAPSDNGGTPITGYEIQRALNSGFTSGAAIINAPSAGSRTVTGLASGALYYFRVRAVNAAGEGAWSTVRSTTPWMAPSVARNLAGESSSDGRAATLTWQAPSDDGGSAITGYSIALYSSTGALLRTQESTDTTTTFTNLTQGVTYRYAVSAINAAGTSPNAAQITLTQSRAPYAPSLSPITVLNGTTARLTITAPTNPGDSEITSYVIQFATNSSFTGATSISKSEPGQYDIDGLRAGQTYYWRVYAVNAAGGGDRSVTRSAHQDQIPGAPESFAGVSSPTGQSITLSWKEPFGDFSAPTLYTITRYSASGAVQATYETTLTSLTVTGLTAGTTYQWAVRATNSFGPGPQTPKIVSKQPSPSIKVGDYFDGSSASSGDVTYQWTGTAHGSTSTATQPRPAAWEATFGDGDGALALSSDTALWESGKSVMATFWVGQSEPGGFKVSVGTSESTRAVVPELGDMVASMYVNPARATRLAMFMTFYSGWGTLLMTVTGAPTVVEAGEWTRLVGSFTSPVNAATAVVGITDVAGDGWDAMLGGDTSYFTGAMLTLGESEFSFFDGATPDTEDFDYTWEGAPHQSESRRTTIERAEGQVDPLRDPDCPPFPKPPRAPSVNPSCITAVDRWRRYWVKVPASAVTLSAQTLPILVLSTAGRSISQVRIRFWENPFDLPARDLPAEGYSSEQIISYLPANTTLTLDSMTARAYAEVGERSSIAADHLIYGTNGTPPTWPVMDCGVGYMIALDVPSALPVGAVTMQVQMARRVR